MVVSLLDLGLEELSLHLPYEQVVQGFSGGSGIEYAHAFCKGGKDLCIVLLLVEMWSDVARESCTFCQSP